MRFYTNMFNVTFTTGDKKRIEAYRDRLRFSSRIGGSIWFPNC